MDAVTNEIDNTLTMQFDASAPDGFHCEVCPWESGPDETENAETAASTKKSGAAKKTGAPKANAPVADAEQQPGNGQQPGADDL